MRDRPIAAAAASELRRRWKKLLKRGAHFVDFDPVRRHRMRIQAKTLRYAAEFFAGVFPGRKAERRRKVFVARLGGLLDALGNLNDIAVHEAFSKRLVDEEAIGEQCRDVCVRAFAAGRLSGREEARFASALKEAERALRSFSKAKPFWS